MINLGSVSFQGIQKITAREPRVQTKLPELQNDVFIKSSSVDKKDVEKTSKVSFKGDYSGDVIKQRADDARLWGKLIKAGYDEKFGEGNWEYVCIGRSCACFADALKKYGVPVHIIPISGLTHGVSHGSELANYRGFEDFKNFIYQDGINPDNINNSGKKYVFQDYCDSGASLNRFEEFIRSDAMGMDSENVVFEDLAKTLDNAGRKMKFEEMKQLWESYAHLCNQNTTLSFKHYTAVPKLDCQNLEKINEVKNYPDNSDHKMFIEKLDEVFAENENIQ